MNFKISIVKMMKNFSTVQQETKNVKFNQKNSLKMIKKKMKIEVKIILKD